MRGAFPAVVHEQLMRHHLGDRVVEQSGGRDSVWDEHPPELHPLDFEWYFTWQTARDLASLAGSPENSILCLGAPTVAHAAATAQKGTRITLVDANPFVGLRFPEFSNGRLRRCDVTAFVPTEPADIVFFDAPWYLQDVVRWLSAAVSASKPGALIAFVLFPQLTRPGAPGEIAAILNAASAAGSVEVFEDAVAYETPRFEAEALAAAGLHGCGNWRRGDLVLLRRSNTPHVPVSAHPTAPATSWLTFVIDSQVVKLNTGARDDGEGPWLQPVADRDDFTYASVSARDPRRCKIDLWTSRNRVARVSHFSILRSVLSLLENGISLPQAVSSVVVSPERYQLAEKLVQLLGDVVLT
jgi:hypothetical protein